MINTYENTYMPYRHEEEKHCQHCRVEMGFSCVKYDVISYNMFWKWSSSNNSIITLAQQFIFLWTKSCILTHRFIGMNTAVGPYKIKSLNLCDKPFNIDHSVLFQNFYVQSKQLISGPCSLTKQQVSMKGKKAVITEMVPRVISRIIIYLNDFPYTLPLWATIQLILELDGWTGRLPTPPVLHQNCPIRGK